MNRNQPAVTTNPAARSERRSSTTWAAFVVGVPLAAAVIGLIQYGPFRNTMAAKYTQHKCECVEVLLFCCAVSALGAKFWQSRTERAACRAAVLPPWDGQPAPVTTAGGLLASLDRLPQRFRNSYLVRRVGAVLDFLCSRGSANELDDQMRALADNDSVALEASYSLTRFITWAIPILGFLGTVLGITQAISGVNPEVLEKNLSTVTDGLAEAFDTTALGLALTMVTMFISFLVERVEQGILEAVDGFVDRQLAHRFERIAPESSEFVTVVRQNSQALLQTTEQLVRRQAEVWAAALAQVDKRRAEVETRQQERLTAGLESALERTLETHARQLAVLHKEVIAQSGGLVERLAVLATTVRETGREHLTAVAQTAQAVAATTAGLTRLEEGGKQLVRMQELLNQNLAALGEAGNFEAAVQSLTAAIHLLTARAGATASTAEGARRLARPGAAA